METIDWDDFKVRCSCISSVLAESRSNPCLTEKQAAELSELEAKDKLTDKQKERVAELLVKKENSTKVILSDTCIAYLLDEYAWRTEGMVRVTKELMDVPQMQKGIFVEPDSLKLLSAVDDEAYVENRNADGERQRVFNDFLSGEVDAFAGESIMQATKIPDIKSIWDFPTFLCKIKAPLTLANDWQIKGYMDITGAPEGFIANCLVNTPDHVVEKQRWKLLNKLNVATDEAPEFKEKWALLERSMRFNHIPVHKRVFKKEVAPMSAFERQALYDRVKVCREWLAAFHEQFENINL